MRPSCRRPCASGLDANGQPIAPSEDLRQCDPSSIADAAGISTADILNGDITFASGAAFPADQCDPWLTNFQKILTDGDPNETGIFPEIEYQSFVPGNVKLPQRVWRRPER